MTSAREKRATAPRPRRELPNAHDGDTNIIKAFLRNKTATDPSTMEEDQGNPVSVSRGKEGIMPRNGKEDADGKRHSEQEHYGLKLRLKNQGLVGVESKVPIRDASALSLLYTPGVAAPCLEIADKPIRSFELTCRGNTVAVVSDGSAVYGIGSAGPEAALAMLEVRSVFFKTFAGVDAIPIALNTQNCDEIVEICLRLATTFGGIVLEDIAAPKCFTVENNLTAALRIPVFHNDQHGGAIAVYAALINALKVVEKKSTRPGSSSPGPARRGSRPPSSSCWPGPARSSCATGTARSTGTATSLSTGPNRRSP